MLFGCTIAQADMLQALKAYEERNYTVAQQTFAELLPLGNELAAFNLGAMAYQGEGQDADLVKAIAYFTLAAELKHNRVQPILTSLTGKASAEQLKQANILFEQLRQSVVVVPAQLNQSKPAADMPEPLKRVAPTYPKNAARDGKFGYVALRFLVDEQGEVTAVDTLDAYPENTFEKSAIQAVKKWRYAASEKKHLFNVRLDYSLEGYVKLSTVEKVVAENHLWDYAVAGAPQYQFALGMLLSLMEVQSHNSLWFDPDLALSAEPDFSIYKKRATLRPDFDGFWGYAVVRVAPDGTITEQLEADIEAKSEITSLIGQKLKGEVEAEVYRINRQSDIRGSKMSVTASLQVPRSMSGQYWWQQAAKNGSVEAQRVMAAYDKQWENYLLARQDEEVMAWTGTRLILEGQREQGMLLLEQAIAKNYAPAKEMKQQFM
jgi:TonB family protein